MGARTPPPGERAHRIRWGVRLALLAVLAAGCDALFGVATVTVLDAPPVDARGTDAPDAPPDAEIVLGVRYVFVTSTPYSAATVGGLTTADMHCAALASAARLPGRYRAWLSTSTVAARDHIRNHTGGPFELVVGSTVVASDWNQLVSGTLQNPIERDEMNNMINFACDVWTNTRSDGSILYPADPTMDCDDWQSTSTSQIMAGLGESTSTQDWTDNPSCAAACSVALRLYCIEDA